MPRLYGLPSRSLPPRREALPWSREAARAPDKNPFPGMAHSVAVIPCYNEGNNPAAVVASVLVEPLASVILVDDASDGMSRAALDALSLQPRVRVLRNRIRSGKSAAARRGFENLPADAANVMMIDGDVVLPPATVRQMGDPTARSSP